MNHKLKALPIMVANYAKLFGVKVKIAGSVAYTNGKLINIPRLDLDDPVAARLAYGYLAHESAHVRYTNFAFICAKGLNNNLLMHSILNILEDCRIEKLISRRYIGVYENLCLLNDYYEKEWQSFCETINQVNVINVILSFVQCYCQSYCQKFSSSRAHAVLIYWNLRNRIKVSDLNKIAKIAKESIKAESTEEIYEYTLKIYEILTSLNFEFKDDKKLPPDYEHLNTEALQNAYTTAVKTIGEPGSAKEDRFLKEFAKFAHHSKYNAKNTTPGRDVANILDKISEEGVSREDLGRLKDDVCREGRADYLDTIDSTYGIRRSLNAKVRGYVDAYAFNAQSGRKLDARRAARTIVGDTKIYKAVVHKSDFATSIHILVDISSSMLADDNTKVSRGKEACKAALMLATALEGIDGIKTMVTYFPGVETEYEVALRANERASKVAPRFDQAPRGSTPLAQALWFAFDCLGKLQCSRNIIFIITDGLPDSAENVENCKKYAKDNGIEIYGLSIRCDSILQYFENAQIVSSAKELAAKSFSLFNRLFALNKQKLQEDLF